MEKNITSLPKKNSYIGLSFGILALLSAVALGFHAKNTTLSTTVESQKNEIASLDAKIAELRADKNLAFAQTIKSNADFVEKAVASSHAEDYLAALKKLQEKYGITFDGFSLDNGKIATTTVSESADQTEAVRKLQALIADAGSSRMISLALEGGKTVNFELGHISFISGDSSRRVAEISFIVR